MCFFIEFLSFSEYHALRNILLPTNGKVKNLHVIQINLMPSFTNMSC